MNALARHLPGLVVGLLAAAPALAAEPDYSSYARLLADHLTAGKVPDSDSTANPTLGPAGFDYQPLRGPAGRAELHAILLQLAVSPSRMSAAERTAWAINSYNFLVIGEVVRRLEQRPSGLASVRDVKDFFDAPVVEVEHVKYSLDAFERHFLFADFDRTSDHPPARLDPRVHFAIVCAARACPPLAARPYRAATLDRDLDEITRRALGSPSHVREDEATGRFAISSIFDWYEKDFGGRKGVIAFLQRYGPIRLRQAIARRGSEALSGFIAWDWRLNQPEVARGH